MPYRDVGYGMHDGTPLLGTASVLTKQLAHHSPFDKQLQPNISPFKELWILFITSPPL